MPVEVISYMFSCEDFKKRLQFQIIFQCAPFLKGFKIACIINLEVGACKELDWTFSGTEIKYYVLMSKKNRCLVLFYREKEFRMYLEKEDVQSFLEEFGYRHRDMDSVLLQLSERVCRYSEKDMGFPHEMGVFLDYPIEDIVCFIREAGKNSLMNGYWKVYHNPRRAQMTFHVYDRAKVSAVNEFLMGKPMRDIVCQKTQTA